MRALRPDIVYVDISGYGPDGPYARKNAYDLVMQGEAGLIAVTGTPAEPARVGVSVCDVGAASYAAVAALAALARRAETGEGARVSVSLFDTMVDWLGYFPHLWWHRRETPGRTGMHHPLFCPYGPYPAGDGKLFGLAVLSPEHWNALCVDVIERPELLDDQRLATNEGRVEHRSLLEPLLEEAFAARASRRVARAGSRPRGSRAGPSTTSPRSRSTRSWPTTGSSSRSTRPPARIPVIGSPFLVDGERPAVGRGARARRAHRGDPQRDRPRGPVANSSTSRRSSGPNQRRLSPPRRSRGREPGSSLPGSPRSRADPRAPISGAPVPTSSRRAARARADRGRG